MIVNSFVCYSFRGEQGNQPPKKLYNNDNDNDNDNNNIDNYNDNDNDNNNIYLGSPLALAVFSGALQIIIIIK